MRMLDMDLSELKNLSKVTEKEALEFLKEGVEVICRIHPREFVELRTESDLYQCKKLKEEKIYELMELFIE